MDDAPSVRVFEADHGLTGVRDISWRNFQSCSKSESKQEIFSVRLPPLTRIRVFVRLPLYNQNFLRPCKRIDQMLTTRKICLEVSNWNWQSIAHRTFWMGQYDHWRLKTKNIWCVAQIMECHHDNATCSGPAAWTVFLSSPESTCFHNVS